MTDEDEREEDQKMALDELHRNYIAGEWVEGDAQPDVNPSNTDDVVGYYARASAAPVTSRPSRSRVRISSP